METEERAPFEPKTADWYHKPLDYKCIIYEPNFDTHVCKITLNRPGKMNSLSHELRAEFFHAIKVAEHENDINVILIKGNGRCFSAGYDLSEGIYEPNEPDLGSQYKDVSAVVHWPRYCLQQWWQLWELSKVVIAQTHGYCLAGGSELCSFCDLLVTTPDCQFGYPPVRAMGADVMWFPWLLPMRKAHEMAFTGDSISGEEAYRLGMANYSVREEDIEEFTETFAKRVAIMPWQIATQYKRSIKKVYEQQGIRTALETSALFSMHLVQETEYVKKMTEMLYNKPLGEYLSERDKAYKDYRNAEKAILDRANRETEE